MWGHRTKLWLSLELSLDSESKFEPSVATILVHAGRLLLGILNSALKVARIIEEMPGGVSEG